MIALADTITPTMIAPKTNVRTTPMYWSNIAEVRAPTAGKRKTDYATTDGESTAHDRGERAF